MAWDGWDFVLGTWEGEGGGEPGQGTGGFTFAPELDGRILVRRSFTEFPPHEGRPAFRHDDLIIVDRDDAGTIRATYWDNEGHRIDYEVTDSETPRAITFQTREKPGAERIRFIYWDRGPGRLEFTFDLAAPGASEFTTHVRGNARRVER